jgi:putative membrane protein
MNTKVRNMQRDYDSPGNRGRFPTTLVAVAVAVAAVMVVIFAVFAYFSSRNPYYGNGYGNYGGYGMMGGFGGYWMLFMIPVGLIVLFVIGYAIWRGLGWGWGGCGGHYGHYTSVEERETASEILRRRYARGEISKEQYEQMKKDIS